MLSERSNDSFVLQDTSGVRPAVDMAIEQINSSPNLLLGYSLTYNNIVVNSQVRESEREREIKKERVLVWT